MAIDAGLHFLRLLAARGLGRYRAAFVAAYPLAEPPGHLDAPARSYLDVMGPRVPDGAALYDALVATVRRPSPALPATPSIAAADQPAATAAALDWLAWCDALFSDRPNDAAVWNPERMEYQFAVSARMGDGREVTLEATEYTGGRLDWDDFTIRDGVSLGATVASTSGTSVRVPSPVAFRGMPAGRFWQFEDRQVNLSAVTAGPGDLARLVLLDFALIYGNDWFVLPVPVDVGSVCRIRSLVLTDTFEQVTPIPHYRAADGAGGAWRMFANDAPDTPVGPLRELFLLPPVLARQIDGAPVEEVLVVRDEMANLAWGIERRVESAAGAALDRFELYRDARPPAPAPDEAGLVYRLASEVPDHWIPLVPVPSPTASNPAAIRLRRGTLIGPGGPADPREPWGQILGDGQDLSLFDEEVPRAGVRLTRAYRYARWGDGSSHLWLGRQKQPGRGEGSSGLRFDLARPHGWTSCLDANPEGMPAGRRQRQSTAPGAWDRGGARRPDRGYGAAPRAGIAPGANQASSTH